MRLNRSHANSPITGHAIVIGGANIDVFGFPGQDFILHDSNPGYVKTSLGGVGRNIAENLVRLDVQTVLLTVAGGDANGKMLMDGCQAAGIDMSHVLVLPEMPSSVYLAVMDESGEMHVGVNQMDILSQITPQYIDACADIIEEAGIIVIDANLSEETILYIMNRFSHKPIFADPVSTAKCRRMSSALPLIHTLKPNALQAGALVDMDTGRLNGVAEASHRLNALGVRRVFTTLGTAGVYCVGGGESFHFRYPPVQMANATGAGDAFTAGLAVAYLQGMGLRETAAFASAIAALTVQSEHPISSDLNAAKAWEEFDKVMKEGTFE